MKNKILLVLLLLVIGAGVYSIVSKKSTPEPDSPEVPIVNIAQLNNKALDTVDYDTKVYTQGLEFYKGFLYASGGLNGESVLAKYNPNDLTKPLLKKNLDPTIFAEGITILNDTIYQLTYQQNILIKYNANTLQEVGRIPWAYGEGWGLTNDGKNLIANTGSNIIYFLNPANASVVKTINVANNGNLVNGLNEMEFVNGIIYANQYTTDFIYKIDASSGNILAVGDFKNILPGYSATEQNNKEILVLNGIAYNPAKQTFIITGKKWPKAFEIKL